MLTVIAVAAVALLALGVFWYKRAPAPDRSEEYNALTTAEQKYHAVRTASSENELRAMWGAWASRGWSEGGLLHGHVLSRIVEVGGRLQKAERDALAQWPELITVGKTLPKIHGRGA